MPPKPKYTKEEIFETAFCIVKENGMSCLTARSLAFELGTSTAPIFTAFSSIEEIQNLIIDRAWKIYSEEYFNVGFSGSLPFKGAGLKYIQFAKDYPELFKILFMQGKGEEFTHFFPKGDPNAPTIIKTVKNNYKLDENKAKGLYNHLSVYVHGLAVMYAQGQCVYTMEDVSEMLSEVFNALKGKM